MEGGGSGLRKELHTVSVGRIGVLLGGEVAERCDGRVCEGGTKPSSVEPLKHMVSDYVQQRSGYILYAEGLSVLAVAVVEIKFNDIHFWRKSSFGPESRDIV